MAGSRSTRAKAAKKLTQKHKALKEPIPTEKLMPTRTEVVVSMLTTEIRRQLNAALQKSYQPYLKDELCLCKRLDEARLKKYGDYMCYNIFRIFEKLRSEDPSRFKHTSSKTMAKEILNNFQGSDMIKGLTLVDVGFLTFKINGQWMVERIEKNLKEGIVAWAPIATEKRAIVDFSTQDMDSEKHADGVRSYYIRHTVVRMLEYSGVEVSGRICNDQALLKVKKCIPVERRSIKKERKGDLIKEKPSPEAHYNIDHEELAALWCGIYEQKADWIVYVTPVRQRDYVMKCFTAAQGYYNVKYFAADRDFKNEGHPTMSYLGYKTSSHEQQMLFRLWKGFQLFYNRRCDLYVGEGMMASGYSREEVFECLIKYAYLKKNAYSDFAIVLEEEMCYTRGNNFLYLLDARKNIRSVINSSRDVLESNKAALAGKEREFGLHLLQFTEVIYEAFSTLQPHKICEYLFKLSENFNSNILKQDEPSENRVLLCKAAEVVMEKGFDLLGITPKYSKGLTSYLREQTGKAMGHYISYPVSRSNPSSRFELFSMMIEVTPPDFGKGFETGELFGYITTSDTCGLLTDGWLFFDENGCGHVPHFVHEFDNSVKIRESCFISFGNPGSQHAVAFSDSVKMGVHLYVTTKKKDACYELCSVDYDIELKDFWLGRESQKRSTFTSKCANGCVSIFYILIKDAVDTSWSLCYMPGPAMAKKICHMKLRGKIVASYGKENMSYEAVMFDVEQCEPEKGNLEFKRSTLAVPVNETLKIKAFLQDEVSRKVFVNRTMEYLVKPEAGLIRWLVEGENCNFELIVDVTVDGS